MFKKFVLKNISVKNFPRNTDPQIKTNVFASWETDFAAWQEDRRTGRNRSESVGKSGFSSFLDFEKRLTKFETFFMFLLHFSSKFSLQKIKYNNLIFPVFEIKIK